MILDLPKMADKWVEEADVKHARHVLKNADYVLFRMEFRKHQGHENI